MESENECKKKVCVKKRRILDEIWCSPGLLVQGYSALVMDELTKSIQDVASWYMMFVDSVVLVDENKNLLVGNLERWRKMDQKWVGLKGNF